MVTGCGSNTILISHRGKVGYWVIILTYSVLQKKHLPWKLDFQKVPQNMWFYDFASKRKAEMKLLTMYK